MEAVDLRENLINSINTLPSNMLEEMYKFLNFLEYKRFSSPDNEEDTLDIFRDTIKDIKNLKSNNNSVLYDGSLDDMIRELK
ncbi:MAG: hypothetical protein Q9M39_05750 [Sulfurovum sp.]|nr:hypothetical protein [Sulfurovum sp.]